MTEIIEYVTDLVLNTDLNIDQIKQQTQTKFNVSNDQFDDALSQIPELN